MAKTGDLVCMAEECLAALELWMRRRKGKPIEIVYLDRHTLLPHEVSPEGKHEYQKQDSPRSDK
jgi:hypothetical protein